MALAPEDGRLGEAASLLGQLRGVVGSMRQNSKWALVGDYGGAYAEEDSPDDPLLAAFRGLRRQLLVQGAAQAPDPAAAIAPFLDVVRSVETSGPITSMALSAVFSILTRGAVRPDTPGAAAVMHSVADAVTHCRFEATDLSSDEVVLAKILQVLLATLTCSSGQLLTDDDVCNIVQASYRIGHQSSKEGELLQQTSRHVLSEVVRTVFLRLAELQPQPDAEALAGDEARPALSPTAGPAGTSGSAASGAGDVTTPTATANGGAAGTGSGGGVGTAGAAAADPGPPYGLPCMVEILRFLVSLVGVDDGPGGDDMCALGLSLVNVALETGGPAFAQQAPLLNLLLDDLSRAIVNAASQTSSLVVLTHCCNAIMLMYVHLRPHCKLQLQAFLKGVLLPLGEGRGVAFEHQRAALEAIVDLCRLPAFIPDLYTNFDCDLSMVNLFEELTSLLSKNAFPVNCPLSAVHLLSLEGLLSVVQSIANRCQALGGAPADPPTVPLTDPEEYEDVWSLEPANISADEPRERAALLKRIKYIKRRLIAGADHFNRKPKKALEFLQSIHLLPAEEDPKCIASFLLWGPGLDKHVIGDFLGDNKDLTISVLKAYTNMFDFKGMNLERALRTFIDGFVLPGEAQKIARVLEDFATRFHECNPEAVADADSAYILSYSIIMLNTDLHNKQVKKKMTLDEFIRNNRGTNGGQDWPRETLENIYNTIANDEIKISEASGGSGNWTSFSRGGGRRQNLCPVPDAVSASMFDGDLFSIIWGPAIAAISVVFDHADDEAVLREALDGFLAVARIASAHRMQNVIDNLVASLCKFTALLNPTAMPSVSPSVAFGEDMKARMAAVTVFSIANKFGDTLREGWCNILDCVLRLHKLGMLPAKLAEDGENGEAGGGSRAVVRRTEPRRQANSTSMFRSISSGFSSLLSLDTDLQPTEQLSEREIEAEQRTMRCIEACRIDEIFSDSKFLESESLMELCKALIWAAGVPGRASSAMEEEDTALFCLQLLIRVTLRNRDRILLLWPTVYEHLKAIVTSARAPSPLVERAITDLLRICQRLLPYKEELADELLQSLRLVFALDARAADGVLERVAAELLTLLKSAADYIRSPTGWDTVCKLLALTAAHPDASSAGFEALALLWSNDAANISHVNFTSCLEAAVAYVGARTGGPERSVRALELLSSASGALSKWAELLKAEGREPTELLVLWRELVMALRRAALDERAEVRDAAVTALQRVLLSTDALSPAPDLWLGVFLDVLLPLTGEVVEHARSSPSEYPGCDRTVRLLAGLLCKVLLQELGALRTLAEFPTVWLGVLEQLQASVKHVKSDVVADAVPEVLKNTLLVFAKEGLLADTPATKKLWDDTWKRAAAVSPSLTPELLSASS